ncbi:MAG: oxygenase MpaB family protein, partial [Actinomycetota bacterium]|nr:oxygenase MpaB family protein [Actinomycetota bacterium]
MTLQERLTASVVKLFSEGDQPLTDTHLYPNDPGLFGPDSVSWKVMGDVSSFAGGVRALLLQALHPEVAAGVADHSAYKSDPLGRLNRTSLFVTTANYGSMPEVRSAVQMVRKAHQPV